MIHDCFDLPADEDELLLDLPFVILAPPRWFTLGELCAVGEPGILCKSSYLEAFTITPIMNHMRQRQNYDINVTTKSNC